MDRPLYMKWFSTGDLITLGTAVASVAIAWGSMSSQMIAQGKQIEALHIELQEIQRLRITPEADARIRVLESQRVGDAREIAELKTELSKRLDILEAQNREILQRLPKR